MVEFKNNFFKLELWLLNYIIQILSIRIFLAVCTSTQELGGSSALDNVCVFG